MAGRDSLWIFNRRYCGQRYIVLVGICTKLFLTWRGLIWEHLGPEWVFIVPVFTDLFLLKPILFTVPETLNRNMNNE
jgi:hypothetical protein